MSTRLPKKARQVDQRFQSKGDKKSFEYAARSKIFGNGDRICTSFAADQSGTACLDLLHFQS